MLITYMIDIVIRDGRKYKEYTERDGYKKIRKLCTIEKCNNITNLDFTRVRKS